MTAVYPVVTAAEAHTKGMSPWALISVARWNMTRDAKGRPVADTPQSQAVRHVAMELAQLLGLPWGKRRRGQNDNRYRRAA